MKRKITILLAITLFIAMTASATVWRVNNRPNVDAEFTSLASAYSGASAGDTIYLEGSPFGYGNCSFFKPLTVIGAGYWLNENDSTQAYKEASIVGKLTFNAGSEGSVIEGLWISFSSSGTVAVDIKTNNITIRRNHINAFSSYYSGYYAYGIYLGNTYNSITIEQNWISSTASYPGNSRGIGFGNYCVNSIIRNNIITVDTNEYAISMGENEAASLIISNNVIMGKVHTFYSSLYNNILLWGTYNAGTGDMTSNNLCSETQFPDENGNQQNVDMTTVFEDYTTYIDNGYLLKTGSPAIGAGMLGVDCGVFGTNDPYVLSGMPPIPAIFEVEMIQSIGATTLPVTIKAKSHK